MTLVATGHQRERLPKVLPRCTHIKVCDADIIPTPTPGNLQTIFVTYFVGYLRRQIGLHSFAPNQMPGNKSDRPHGSRLLLQTRESCYPAIFCDRLDSNVNWKLQRASNTRGRGEERICRTTVVQVLVQQWFPVGPSTV